MTENQKAIETIFMAALEIESESERNAFLNAQCAGNPELRQRIESLLAANQEMSGFLDGTKSMGETEPYAIGLEQTGAQIGPYTLMEQIGEGGMGLVYVAEQQQPVKRRVALKLIKAGMDSKEVLARFAAERQALAMMDHPNIAKVLDAGQTDSGRPYFVMELVKGLSITEYCDQHQLDNQQRLQLFMDVCSAVQHAHQKGIIHRDLKPSNVLVSAIEQRPHRKGN